jgi:4-amino-4-deoxy-L-arabinose transferase-like glycosyltransferase
MTNQNNHEIVYHAIAAAAGLGVAGFLYFLWTCGVSVAGLLLALGMIGFVSAITVAATVILFRSKEQ